MNSNSRTAVSSELSLGLVGPERTIVPLMASLYYSCHDPYAVKIAFHVGTDEPVEWTLARDLAQAYELVPVGQESTYLDFEAELAQLLSEA